MSEINDLEEIVANIKNIEPFGIEPFISSLGIEQAELLGFKKLEKA